MRKWSLFAILMALLSGCSAGTHNLSKGTCRGIEICDGNRCTSKTEHMTQNHCEMVGGTFTPANHSKGWFHF